MIFSRRAHVQRTAIFHRRIWYADDGVHRVSECYRLTERRTVYYAERCDQTAVGLCWDIVSRHRTRRAAELACQQDARRAELPASSCH